MDPQQHHRTIPESHHTDCHCRGHRHGVLCKEFDLIVTNDHVVAENAEVTIAGKAFEKALSRVWYTDRKHDLAFLQAPTGY